MYFHSEQVVTAALDVGSRVLVAPVYFDRPDAGWLDTLDAISKWIDADGLRFGPADRVELCYGPHSAYALPLDALRTTAEQASARDALVHIHVAESVVEDVDQRAAYGSVVTFGPLGSGRLSGRAGPTAGHRNSPATRLSGRRGRAVIGGALPGSGHGVRRVVRRTGPPPGGWSARCPHSDPAARPGRRAGGRRPGRPARSVRRR